MYRLNFYIYVTVSFLDGQSLSRFKLVVYDEDEKKTTTITLFGERAEDYQHLLTIGDIIRLQGFKTSTRTKWDDTTLSFVITLFGDNI